MRVALPTWDGRISPVFDVARRLLVVDVERDAEIGRSEVDLEETRLAARASRVTALGVHVLICGAISWPLEAMLTSAGIRLIPQICGPVEDVLRAFLAGQLPDEAFLMPGCCGRRRRFRGGRRHGGRPGAGRWRGMA
ncbi:MAG: NifB/NifX family molybdenum-iron cluster-binding protein [Phycisphaerae bacterium]|nr:NifB/NifX family molybdenum-iron cluster-binding protein [Phycisphaerae bacterium]